MGKWKYINWLIVLIIIAHMYYYFSNRYEANLMVYVLSTAGWLSTAILGYYIFMYRINRSGRRNNLPIAESPLPKSPLRERPKVTFKKKDQH